MSGIDASTAATIAALVVAILAMLVALSQVVQQYLFTGQLIRLCDSVVYGKMPGRGRRVWQLNQLRFRVVYSIPQVSLRKELWPSKLPHIPSYAKGSRALPDLGLAEIGDSDENFEFDNLSDPETLVRSPVSFTAGEASWVSFCRAVQPSSGRSMVLDLIQADADRCPPDLPNVPIQMSMRDIAVMGLMAGMKCTQASFDSRSLSMQGLVGTITTSQHPLLGPLLHFNPRNLSSKEMGDLQIGHGAIDPSWMARLWDEVTIAGHLYTRHERMQIERDEAMWAKRPRERAIVPAGRNRSPPPASLYSLRRRSSVASTTAVSSQATGHDVIPRTDTETAASSCQECQPLWTRSDGDWYLDNGSSHTNQVQSTKSRPLDSRAKVKNGTLKETSKVRQALWVRVWTVIWQSRKRRRPNTPSDPFGLEVELGNFTAGADHRSRVHPVRVEASRHNLRRMHLHSHPAGLDQGATLQPRWFIKDYIDRKRAEMQDRELTDAELRDGPLLLGWYDDEGQEIAELNETKENLAKMVLEIWATTTDDPGQQRAAFYARKWRDVVRQRQLNRESRNKNRPSSTNGPFRNRSQYGQSNRYRSSDSTRSRRTFNSEYRWSRAPSRTSFYSGPAGEEIDPDLQRYGKSASQAPTPARDTYTYSRSSSHVRSRPPVKRDVEYGNTKVVVTPEAQSGETLKSPDSDGRSQSHARVGFDHEIQYFIHSSGSERDADESEKLSLVGKASVSTGKESSKDRPEANVDPPPKGILKPSKIYFPEEPNPVREGVAPLKNAELDGVPPGARWTKIDRRLVSPAALEAGKERFEERNDHVVVLRVLQKEEIQEYALRTIKLRGRFMTCNLCALLLTSAK